MDDMHVSLLSNKAVVLLDRNLEGKGVLGGVLCVLVDTKNASKNLKWKEWCLRVFCFQ